LLKHHAKDIPEEWRKNSTHFKLWKIVGSEWFTLQPFHHDERASIAIG
jgi:hypothetical protein